MATTMVTWVILQDPQPHADLTAKPAAIDVYRCTLIARAEAHLAAGKSLRYSTHYMTGPIHVVEATSTYRLRFKTGGSSWYHDAGDQILDQIARQLGMATAWDYGHSTNTP